MSNTYVKVSATVLRNQYNSSDYYTIISRYTFVLDSELDMTYSESVKLLQLGTPAAAGEITRLPGAS